MGYLKKMKISAVFVALASASPSIDPREPPNECYRSNEPNPDRPEDVMYGALRYGCHYDRENNQDCAKHISRDVAVCFPNTKWTCTVTNENSNKSLESKHRMDDGRNNRFATCDPIDMNNCSINETNFQNECNNANDKCGSDAQCVKNQMVNNASNYCPNGTGKISGVFIRGSVSDRDHHRCSADYETNNCTQDCHHKVNGSDGIMCGVHCDVVNY